MRAQIAEGEALFTLFVLLKLWAEVALTSLLGQWVLGLMVGSQREGNLVYQLLGVVFLPVVWLVSRLGGRWVPAHRRRLWAAVLLVLLWLVGTAGKIWTCLGQGSAPCS